MKVKMTPVSKIILELGLEPNGEVHQWFTDTCALHMDKYVPMDTGALAETVVVNGEINRDNVFENAILYNQDYASYVYYPSEKIIHQDKHPQACPYWDEVMWTADKDMIVREVQNYFDKRG